MFLLNIIFMENNIPPKEILDSDSNKDKHSNDYKFLAQKLKIIKETIYLLEKNFLNKKK